VNTTPHEINLILEGTTIAIPTSDVSFRVRSESVTVGQLTVEGSPVDVRARQFSDVTCMIGGEEVPLPNQQEGVFYIVSRITAEALPDRSDLLMVDGTVRDDDGRIIGCTGFAQL
jgi:CDP-diacylglycerol pyrophosphatase